MKSNSMGKYNENSSSDSYEDVIDIENNEKVTTKKTNLNKVYWELLEWGEKRRGFKFMNVKKQFKGFSIARENKIQPNQITERWKEFENDKFRIEKGFDFFDIVISFDKKR